jgi:DNA replication protein DnaC
LPEALDEALRRMRLPHMRKAAPEVLATARAQRWDPAEVLRVLLGEETRGRDAASRAARRRQAALPAGKTFDTWRERESSIPAGTQTGLAALEQVHRHENLAVAGPSGTGKSHFVEALCHKAIDQGMRVAWLDTEQLAQLVRRASADGSIARTVKQICRADVIVIDDVGLLPVTPQAAEGFHRVVEAAYEKRSVAVTSNLHPAGLDQIMPKTIATAAVDRLPRHAHVVITQGDSHRLTEATSGHGVQPLN